MSYSCQGQAEIALCLRFGIDLLIFHFSPKLSGLRIGYSAELFVRKSSNPTHFVHSASIAK